jgi:hypothetical protein
MKRNMTNSHIGSGRNYLLYLILFSMLFFTENSKAQISFPFQSSWKYLKGKDAASLTPQWVNPLFDDLSWNTGKAPFRYGDGALGVELTDMMNSYTSLYIRSSFTCVNRNLISGVTFSADYDDGFVLWINGQEAFRKNAPSTLINTGVAPLTHESGTGEDVFIDASKLILNEGVNFVAVQAFNVSLSSTDFYFDISIAADKDQPEFPDTIGVAYNVKSGFYNSPFNVTLSSADPGATIIYTLNGSNPQTSSKVYSSTSPVTVKIDPSDTTGRSLTPAVIIRASATKTGFKPSKPSMATYIFTERIKTQGNPGGDWPVTNVNGQLIDLAIDTRVVNDPLYSNEFVASFKSIPTISVITDNANLFDAATGIYVNADGHGLNWERESSVELINPDGSEGFRINAGLRIRGGWSRHDNYPKHGFRLFFREKYGSAKLKYPLFGQEGVDEFDKIDLRTEQNYAWNNGLNNNSFVRDVFSRDTQRDMGQPYTRSRYFHLWLNGMYWGIYQTQERSEARFAASYLGDKDEDYDVVKVNTDNYGHIIEATDGNLDSWKKIWDLCQKGFETNANYNILQGRDADGKPVKGGEILVDIDNLIDYMLIIFYTGNFDAPTSSFSKNKYCMNFFSLDNRSDRSKGFIFFAHDSEHSMFDQPHSPGIGLYEDRVNLASRADEYKMDISSFSYFHPQWLHYKLSANSEYRDRFAGRAYNHFKEGGVLSAEKNLVRINSRVSEVENAVIAESARWGDAKRTTGAPYTKNGQWLPEIDRIRNNVIPLRSAIVVSQLRKAGLYPSAEAPVISVSSVPVAAKIFNVTAPVIVKITNPNSDGIICYTLNGKDPRNEGGAIDPAAISVSGEAGIAIPESTYITSRILIKGQWSAISEVSFIKDQSVYKDLRITEVNYHPSDFLIGTDTIMGEDLEFLEFRNTGRYSVNLTGLSLDSAVTYTFPVNRLLPPGRYWVLASKPSHFWDYYGMIPSGNFMGNLSNAGEEILLKDKNDNPVINFSYSDTYPWPQEADGLGYSLTSILANPSGNPSDFKYWTWSALRGGTPFGENPSDVPVEGMPSDSLSVYPNPTNGVITIRLKTEDLSGEIEVSVFSLTGHQIYSVLVGSVSVIDLRKFGLPSGSYILRVKSKYSVTRSRIMLVN